MYISGTWKKSFIHEIRWRPHIIHDNTLPRSLQNRWAWGHSDIHRTKFKVNYFSAWTEKYFFKYRTRWWLRRKKMVIDFFYSCLEWHANYLWLWILTCDPPRFDYLTIIILFLSSYFIVSKWWPLSEGNKHFFSAPKFRQRLDSEGEAVTFRSWHNAYHCLTHV